MRPVRTPGLLLVLTVLVAVNALAAEQTGEIRGAVTDPTGAVLPGVLVIARSPSKMLAARRSMLW